MQKYFVEDYIDKKINHLTILEDRGVKDKQHYVLVRCDCEKQTIKEVNFYAVVTNRIKSCGCVKMKNIINSNFKHGMSKSREFKCWVHMIVRIIASCLLDIIHMEQEE